MKRFYISLISVITVVSAWACYGLPPTDNYYMFSVIDRKYFNESPQSSGTDFWDKYIGGESGAYESYSLANVDLKEFNKSKNKIIRTAIKRKDTETINYLKLIIEYSQNNGGNDGWDYPTKQQLAQRKVTLNRIKKAALAYKGTRYKNRYAYLVMRCNMTQKAHKDNIRYWEKVASKLKDNLFKVEMKNMYAGALYNIGQKEKACDIFVEMGDLTSIKYCVRKQRNLEGIKKEYAQNPNLPTLNFLVQDFVNNTQESIDCNYDSEFNEELDTKTILKRESMNFIKFASKVLKEGKTKSPSMWEAARGFINYLYGNQEAAIKQLTNARTLAGTQRMKDNARACLALAKTHEAQPTNEFFDYLLGEFKWLQNKSGLNNKHEGFGYGYCDYYYTDPHYQEVLHRIAVQELIPRFKEWNMPEAALATHCMVDSLDGSSHFDKWAWGGRSKDELDSIPSNELSKFYSYLKRKDVSNLEQWINSQVFDEATLNDLMGTKLIRENKCYEAIQYLEKVPLDYYSSQEISLFMNQRDYKKERWMKQQTKQAEPNDNWRARVNKNEKLKFCRDIININRQIDESEGEKKLQLMYQKASMLFQASFYGDCWYLSQYYTSAYSDNAPVSTAVLADKALSLLRKVKRTTNDNQLKLKSLYGLTYIYGRTDKYFFDGIWDGNGNRIEEIDTQCKHYHALTRLNNFVNHNNLNHVSFISKCDVIKEFRKAL